MIPQRNLSLLAHRLALAGGRRVPENVLERDYCLAWFLVGLSQHPLCQKLAFKGGTVLKRCYFSDYRFSEDLDFTLIEPMSFEQIILDLNPVFATVKAQSNIQMQFMREDRIKHENSYTFYVSYNGPLPANEPKEVKVDITRTEALCFPLVMKPVLRGYDEFSDLPEAACVRTYAIEEVVAEKICAVTDKARNEPRDLYDLWYLTENQYIDFSDIIPAVEEKLRFRKRTLGTLGNELAVKEARLRKLWETRLGQQMVKLPEFDDVFRIVQRNMRSAGWRNKAE